MSVCTSRGDHSSASVSACHPLVDTEVDKRLVTAGQRVIWKRPWDLPRDHGWLGTEWPSFPSAHGFLGMTVWWQQCKAWRAVLCYRAFAIPDAQGSSAQRRYCRERDYRCRLPPGKCTPKHFILGLSSRILQFLHDVMTTRFICCNCILGSFSLALPP